MIARTGQVIGIHATHIEVGITAPAACSQCGSAARCHGPHDKRITLPLSPGLKPGDNVALTLEDRQLHLSALLTYLMPTLALLLGAGLAEAAWPGQPASFFGAAAGLGAGLLALPLASRLLGLAHLTPCVIPLGPPEISTPQESPPS